MGLRKMEEWNIIQFWIYFNVSGMFSFTNINLEVRRKGWLGGEDSLFTFKRLHLKDEENYLDEVTQQTVENMKVQLTL